MKRLPHLLLVFVFGLAAIPSAAQDTTFSFGVIGMGSAPHPDALLSLRTAIAETNAENLGFVVSMGIRSRGESCSEDVLDDRHALLQAAENGVVVAVTAADWAAACRGTTSTAGERLNQLRNRFFDEEFSLGGTRLPVLRQSAAPQFRSYSENMRWELGSVLFATANLPANKNHYVSDAGRNSEFEDRQVANRVWLQRLFRIADYQRATAIVLFVDADPLLEPAPASGRDGFSEVRRQLKLLASRFDGRVLVVSAKPSGQRARKALRSTRIEWNGNTGHLSVPAGWVKVDVSPRNRQVFTLTGNQETSER